MTTVWHNFQANTCSKKSSARLFLALLEQKDVVSVLPTGFCEKFNLAVVRGSETHDKMKKKKNVEM